MELSTTLIGIFMSLLFIGPIWYIQHSQKRKEKKLLKSFKDACSKYEIHPEPVEMWGHKVIGVDKAAKKAAFLEDQGDLITIDLSEMANIKILKKTVPSVDKEIISTIALQFVPANGKQREVLFPFFDVNSDNPLQSNYHFQKAKKWLELIEGV